MKLDRNQLISEIKEMLKYEMNRKKYEECKKIIFKDCNVVIDNIPLEVMDRDILFMIKTAILAGEEKEMMICVIQEQVERNNKHWDLTDNIGEPIVFDGATNYPISDLIINNDNCVCACIPVKSLPVNTVKSILNIVR